MSFLKQALMKELKIERDFEVYTTYKTGFDEFDYRNGFINPETKQQFTGLREGSYTMVIGPSGSGKTTVGRSLLRLYDDYNGFVRLDGKIISGKYISNARRKFLRKNSDCKSANFNQIDE
mgnify:CR=1 FL=1